MKLEPWIPNSGSICSLNQPELSIDNKRKPTGKRKQHEIKVLGIEYIPVWASLHCLGEVKKVRNRQTQILLNLQLEPIKIEVWMYRVLFVTLSNSTKNCYAIIHWVTFHMWLTIHLTDSLKWPV